jgi:hypothetical protein
LQPNTNSEAAPGSYFVRKAEAARFAATAVLLFGRDDIEIAL